MRVCFVLDTNHKYNHPSVAEQTLTYSQNPKMHQLRCEHACIKVEICRISPTLTIMFVTKNCVNTIATQVLLNVQLASPPLGIFAEDRASQ